MTKSGVKLSVKVKTHLEGGEEVATRRTPVMTKSGVKLSVKVKTHLEGGEEVATCKTPVMTKPGVKCKKCKPSLRVKRMLVVICTTPVMTDSGTKVQFKDVAGGDCLFKLLTCLQVKFNRLYDCVVFVHRVKREKSRNEYRRMQKI